MKIFDDSSEFQNVIAAILMVLLYKNRYLKARG